MTDYRRKVIEDVLRR